MKKIDASLQLTRQIVSYIWEKIEKKELIPSSSPIDIDTLINSGKLFCRKVITGKSDKLMDMIDNYRQSHSILN